MKLTPGEAQYLDEMLKNETFQKIMAGLRDQVVKELLATGITQSERREGLYMQANAIEGLSNRMRSEVEAVQAEVRRAARKDKSKRREE